MLGRVRRQGGVSLALLPQPWDRAAPEHTVLYGTSSRSPGPSLYDEAACLHAAPNPDGHTLCLVLKDGAQNCNYLAERDIRWEPMDRIGVPLTSPGHTIVPDSVQYSPEGTLISYMRRKRDRRELWVVASGGSETDGVTLAVGSLGRYSAFSPDGRYMAVDVTEPGRPEPVVLLIDVATRAVEAQLGPGCLGKEPWHPSGDLLLVTHRSESQNDQMWAVETAPPHRRSRLTSVSGGIDPGCALSRCGTWAAGVVANSEHPTLILVDMRPVSFRNAT